jgi:hypothetical protein
VSNWEKIGSIAAVVAAVAAAGAFAVAWIYGRRASHDSTKAVKYERLREARDLVSIIRTTGDNIRFADLQRRLRAPWRDSHGSRR